MPRLIISPDEFLGTASAPEVAAAMAKVARRASWEVKILPAASGGRGLLGVLGGQQRRARVHDPLGRLITAEFRLDGRTATVDSAEACGLSLVGGPAGNDPVAADTAGVGELVAAAVVAGARRVVVGTGASATTDGGLGAVRALEPISRLRGVELVVACDVPTRFLDAAGAFAPAKGASDSQVALLARRMERVAQIYDQEFGIDVRPLEGGGAGGGLAGGLAAVGALLRPGFDVVAEALELAEHIEEADLVVTGEAYVDPESLHEGVVGGVCALAAEVATPVLIVASEVDPAVGPAVPEGVTVLSLQEHPGPDGDVLAGVSNLLADFLGPAARTD